MNTPTLLDKPPAGTARRKYSDLIALALITALLRPWASNAPLDGALLAMFCAAAAGLAAVDANAMWKLKPLRMPRWAGVISELAAIGLILGLVFLDGEGIFVWNHVYFVAPTAIYLGLTALGAWFIETRKQVLIYQGFAILAYVRPPAPPLTRKHKTGLIVLALAAIWMAFILLHDESLDAGFDQFYFANRAQVPDNENIAIAMSGLSAPPGSDFMEYGHTAVEIWRAGLPPDVARARIEAHGKLDFDGRNEDLQCWDEPLPRPKDTKCGSEAAIPPLLKSNAEMLERYRKMQTLPHFSGVAYKRALEINLNKLVANEILLDIRDGRGEIAFDKWRDNQKFRRRMMSEDETWFDKALELFLERISLATAEQLMHMAPRLADEHYPEMKDLLRDEGIARYNIAGVMRAEYLLRDPLYTNPAALKYWVHPNFLRNRFYRFAQDFLKASTAPPSEIAAAADAVVRAHTEGWSADYLTDPINAVFARSQVGGPAKIGQLLQQMVLHDGQMRLLLLRLEILHSNIPDSGIEDFLKHADKSLANPFTGAPMQWSPSKRALYFRSGDLKPSEIPVGAEVRL